MVTRRVSVEFTGNATSAVRAITDVEKAADKSAKGAAASFDKSTSRIGGALQKLGNAGSSFTPLAGAITAVGKSFDKSTTKGQSFGSTLSKIGKVEAVAAGAGIAFLATQVGDFINQGRDSAQVLRLTEAVLKSTGGAAGVTATQVAGLADALSAKAGVDDELIQRGENVLLTFTQVRNEAGKGNDIFTQGTKASLDLSAALGQDLQQSIIQVGKALNDPIAGMTALKRVGVSFTESQKDQIKTLAKSGDVLGAQKIILKELKTEFGGAAEAAADPFSKLSVQIENVKESIGTALIPKVLELGRAAASLGHGFGVANDATGGFLGKGLAIAAGIPVAVFAIEKLDAAGAAVAGSYSKLGSAFKTTTVEAEAATVANTALATSEGAVGEGAVVAGAGFGGLGAAIAAAAASLLIFQSNSKSGHNVFENGVPGLPNAFATPHQSGSDRAQIDAGLAFVATQHATQDAVDQSGDSLAKTQRAMTLYTEATLRGDTTAKAFTGTSLKNLDAISGFSVGIDQAVSGLDAGQKAQLRYSLALQQYTADSAPGAHVSNQQLKDDAAELLGAQRDMTLITGKVNAVLDGSTDAAGSAGFAYLGLADSIKTAAQASAALSDRAFAPVDASIAANKSALGFQDAVAALHAPPGAAGGGAGRTATASALDQTSKQTAVRDALLGVTDAAVGVTTAQKTLTKAQKDSATAAQELKTAEHDYEQVLDGVAAGSKEARAAQDALTAAQDASKSSALDLIDAQRSLADAIVARQHAGREAREDVGSAGRGVTGAQLDLKDAREALSRARETEDPETIARAQLALGDAQQRVSDAVQARTEAQKHLTEVSKGTATEDENVKRANIALTEAQLKNKQAGKDQTEAQRVLNGTLHGFLPTARESKDALSDLTQAQQDVSTATDAVTTAQRGLITATNQVSDASTALFRAQADLAGKLDAVTSSAKKGLAGYISAFDDVRAAAKVMAEDVRKRTVDTTGSVALGILAEVNKLKDAVAAEPLLAGAFDAVFANLEKQYLAIAAKPGSIADTIEKLKTSSIAGHKASGGPIEGNNPSGIPIVAHPGEWVIRQKAVQKYGPHMMDMLNRGALPKFAAGGAVGGHIVPHTELVKSRPVNTGGQIKVEVHIHGNVYGVADLERVVLGAVQKHYLNGGRSLSSRPR